MNPAAECRVAVLGPVQVAGRDGTWSEVPGVNGKALVVSLVLARGQVVSVPALVDDIWQDEPPRNGKAALQTLVSRLRSAAGDELIESVAGGYRLGVPPELVDLWSPDAPRRGEPGADLGALELAERLRRVADSARAAHLATRAEAELGSGQTAAAVADARLLANASPYDEEAQLLVMRALAASGRQGDALRSFAEFRERLADELGTDPGDALIAFNVELLRQEQAAAAQAAADEASAAAHPAGSARTVGLRAAPNALIGRDADVLAIEALVVQSRLTTILGAGGLGKTRLAQELAHRATDRFEQVVIVELASIRSADDVPLAVASALGVGETSGGRLRLTEPLVLLEVRARIVTALGERPTLLVLDNCEHVVEAAAYLLGEILAAIPTVTVLATSRAPLQIGAESVYPLEPLAADEQGPAVQLFLERARAARPGAVLPPEVVARLCARLDGLPLAIELAAARIRSMSVDEIERRLGNRFALLTGGDRSAPERHRTLIAVIDWSWNLLDDEQRRLLRRLSRFPDGFSADAAAAVAGGGDPVRAADALDALVGQSLVTVGETEDGDARYRMLETVREFGDMALVDAGEERLVADATAAWARAFALASLDAFLTAEQATGIRRLEIEHENLLTVLRRAIDPDSPDPAVVYPVFAALVLYWMVHNQISEVIGFVWPVTQTVRTAPIADDASDAAALTLLVGALMGIAAGQMGDQALGPGGAPIADEHFPLPPEARSGGLRSGLRLATRLRRLTAERPVSPWISAIIALLSSARSQDKALEMLASLRASSDPQVATLAQLFSGLLTENTGDTETAVRFVRGAYDGARRLGTSWTMAQAAQNLAHLSSQRDQPETTLRWAAEATARFDELHAVEDERQLEWVIALNRIKLGQREGAAEAFERFTTDESNQPGFDQYDLRAIGWAGLAELAAAEGDAERAVELYRRGEAVFADGPRAQRLSPWRLIVAAGSVAQAALADKADGSTRKDARALRVATRVAYRVRGAMQTDRPVIGAALLGVAAWLLARRDDATDAERAAGTRLLAFAEGLNARQDLPVLRHPPLAAFAEAVAGAEALAAARLEVAGLSLAERTAAAMELLAAIRI